MNKSVKWVYVADVNKMPETSGVYKISYIEESVEFVVYIGRSFSLRNRLRNHKQFIKLVRKELTSNQTLVIAFFETPEYVVLERELIKELKPKHNCEKGKEYSSITSQIRLALDGRKLRWLVFKAMIHEGDLNRKMSGKMEFTDDEIDRIEKALSFTIDRQKIESEKQTL